MERHGDREAPRTVIVEGSHHFPPESLHREYFTESRSRSLCFWKGLARYYSVTLDGRANPNAAAGSCSSRNALLLLYAGLLIRTARRATVADTGTAGAHGSGHRQGRDTEVRDGCPSDCGLCPEHKQHACPGIIEVNTGCNLDCPICFADSGHQPDGYSVTHEQCERMRCTKVLRDYADHGLLRLARGRSHHRPGPRTAQGRRGLTSPNRKPATIHEVGVVDLQSPPSRAHRSPPCAPAPSSQPPSPPP
ncbi:DUF427 domain-containing protein [Streptomyces sp. 8N706]|uniref:DUF427 domain-containing protein n=1 Tax=Streptomyces sp. 8N706 TaxID=3457416 RepID=UPI003FD3B1DD